MVNTKQARLRRAKRARSKIKLLRTPRLCVHKTAQHMYVQLIDVSGKVLACASTVEKELKSQIEYSGNIAAAQVVGKAIAARGIEAKVKQVAFDRSGFKYHGRVKALAEAAREGGLEF